MTIDLAAYEAAGYTTLSTPSSAVDPAAARMLTDASDALGIAVAGDVLQVALASAPTPARVHDLQERSGMAVSIAITTPEVLEALRAQVAAPVGAPSGILAALLREATQVGASDITLVVGSRPTLRVNGEIQFAAAYAPVNVTDLATAKQWLIGERTSAAVEMGADRWRIRELRAGGQPALTLRRLPSTPRRSEDLNVPVALVNAAATNHGLIVVASGPGGGKSTTSAALVDRINTLRPAHVAVIGAPVEVRHRSRRALITEQHLGVDAHDAADAVSTAELLGADVITLDVRTHQDAQAALLAAVAGHLVIATVSAVSTTNALRHLVALFPAHERDWAAQALGATLRVATAQQLLTSTTGELGAVFEVLTVNAAVRSLLTSGAFDHLPSSLDDGVGASSMERALAHHVASGRLDVPTARAAAGDVALFDENLEQSGAPASAAHLPADPQPESTRATRRAPAAETAAPSRAGRRAAAPAPEPAAPTAPRAPAQRATLDRP